MPDRFDHEKLDVYNMAIEFVAWSSNFVAECSGASRHPRDQLLRSSQSIPLNIAEGNGKRSGPERRRYFEIARGSAMEAAATLDVLVAIKAVGKSDVLPGKGMLLRIVGMLVRLAPPPEVRRGNG